MAHCLYRGVPSPRLLRAGGKMGIGSWVPGPLTFKYLRGIISHQSLIKQSYAPCSITTFFFALHYHSFTFLRQCQASNKLLRPPRR